MEQYINKIIHADCLDILKQLPDKCVDLVLTDPPYGMNFVSNYRTEKYSKIKDDDNLKWLPDWIKDLKRVISDNAHLYIFCSWHHIDEFKKQLELAGLQIKNILIWVKNNTGMGDLVNDYAPQYEMCLYVNLNNKKLNGYRDSNILRFKRTNNELHPTQKPVDLFSYLIEKSSNPNDLVLDCFSGSGTTAVACHNLKRRFICIEKDEDYYKASVERLNNVQAQLKLF